MKNPPEKATSFSVTVPPHRTSLETSLFPNQEVITDCDGGTIYFDISEYDEFIANFNSRLGVSVVCPECSNTLNIRSPDKFNG